MSLFLLYIPLWLLALLLYVLVSRRAYLVSPCFFMYAAFGVAACVARFVTRNHPHPYFDTYWITEGIFCVLGMLAMYEVLRTALKALPCAWWARVVFPLLLLASVELSLVRTHAAPPQAEIRMFGVLIGEMAVRFVQVFIFAGLASLVPLIGLRWHRYSFGVALGFGLYATVMLVNTTRLADSGTRFTATWGVISTATYSVSVLIWIWFFWMPPKVTGLGPRTIEPAVS